MAEISVTSGAERETTAQQVGRILESLRALQHTAGPQEVRLRLPLNIFDPDSKTYTQIRNTFWHLRLPASTATSAQIEAISHALGVAIRAIARDPAYVIEALGPAVGAELPAEEEQEG